MKEEKISGRVWVLVNQSGSLLEDIDTDQIYHNAHLHITEITQMGQYALGNLRGWEDFPRKARPGDIIIAGRNFGAGSSRQQAVDCFLALGISAILAPSYSSIYFRNAVNSGLPVLRSQDLPDLVARHDLETGDVIEVNVATGHGLNRTKKISFLVEPLSSVQRAIWEAGNLFAFGRAQNRLKTR